MEIKFIYPRWGSANLKWSVFLEKVKANGFQGVEIDLPLDKKSKTEIKSILSDFDLTFVAQHWQTKEVDFNKHKQGLKKHLYNLAEAKPLFINSHTGMDFFSFSQNVELLKMAQAIEEETGIKITHETHRSRFSFAAHVCHSFLIELPFLKLTADFSHWCCVAESLLENQEAAVQKAIQHTYHIHARVGSSQSPQVINPNDTIYQNELQIHKKWWQSMIENAIQSNRSFLAITTEYGPFPYTLYQPQTTTPLANQWDINLFIKKELEKLLDC
jgi:sugar phosphate isomerase/epimerase